MPYAAGNALHTAGTPIETHRDSSIICFSGMQIIVRGCLRSLGQQKSRLMLAKLIVETTLNWSMPLIDVSSDREVLEVSETEPAPS